MTSLLSSPRPLRAIGGEDSPALSFSLSLCLSLSLSLPLRFLSVSLVLHLAALIGRSITGASSLAPSRSPSPSHPRASTLTRKFPLEPFLRRNRTHVHEEGIRTSRIHMYVHR